MSTKNIGLLTNCNVLLTNCQLIYLTLISMKQENNTEYKVKITDEKDFLLAIIKFRFNGVDRELVTFGNDKDIFYKIGDCLACFYEIPYPKWKKLIIKLFRL